jgi:glycosyltransferase involved in cell wall biosynthesis
LKYYPFGASKIVVTKEGIAQPYAMQLQRHEVTTKNKRLAQLIYVGSLYPHKNVKVILEALKQLPDYKLLLVGTRTVFQTQTLKQVQLLGVEKQVVFSGYLTDEELIKLYQTSLALIQPSLSEGFGLTGVEAMASGIPVIASRIPIFQEIYQDAAQYFDPMNPASFAQAVHELELADWPKTLQKGAKVAAQYNWQKTAQATWQAYLQVIR